ncbi:hypothetical protein EW146_g10454 [Bondarzewia mesenterica]|uniref:C2H2-type domain-containing protein n=1 Tax=Bondarzewia mesenterica TaxID=1095465 RepID=A0A4S4KX55_9AGAM|nr:hypothetical protein EW146_g10454 [Bondarzewia mesenterica]
MDGKAVASLGLRAIKPRVEGEAAADALRRNNYKSRETTYENDNLVDVSFPNNSKMSHGGPSAIPPVDLKANQEAFRATKKGRRKSDQEKPHRCTQCGHGFERSNDLKRHLITAVVHHPRSFQCAQCGKFLSRKDALSTHQRTQHGL